MRTVCAARILPLLLLLALPAAARAQFNNTASNGQITITGYTGPGGAVTIPDMLFDLPVTSIGDEAFIYCYSLTSVTIPNSVTSIGDGAFIGCSNLTNITFGNSVTTIGQLAFLDCSSLTSVTIPNSVTTIGIWAFQGCTSLTGVYFYGSAPSVGSNVFDGDNSAVVYYMPGTTGWDSTFGGRPTALWTQPAQVPYKFTTNNSTVTITGYTGPGGDVTIPATINGLPVTSIGGWAFLDCSSLTSVTIPNSVTTIGSDAFYYCTRLTSVTIPDRVTSIGGLAFYGCTNLTAITVDALNSVYSSLGGVLFNRNQTTLIEYPGGLRGSYTIPDSVTSLGGGAFYGCSSLTSVTIPNSVTSIGNAAFADCSGLTNVSIGNSVTNIANYAFADCSGLTRVFFQGNAPSLGGSSVFGGDPATAYYLPEKTGWGATFGGLPTKQWNPSAPIGIVNVGVQANQFLFIIITGSSNQVIVVEACTSLATPAWSAVGTNTLTDGLSIFSDPRWTNYPARFYRLRSP